MLGARPQARAAWEAVREVARARGVPGAAAARALEAACGSLVAQAMRAYVADLRPEWPEARVRHAAHEALPLEYLASRRGPVLEALRAGLGALPDNLYAATWLDPLRSVAWLPEFEPLRRELRAMVPDAFVWAQAHARQPAPPTPPRPPARPRAHGACAPCP